MKFSFKWRHALNYNSLTRSLTRELAAVTLMALRWKTRQFTYRRMALLALINALVLPPPLLRIPVTCITLMFHYILFFLLLMNSI